MTAFAPDSLFASLAHLPDPRSPHGRRFSLSALLASACAAVLCGHTSYAAIAQWTRNQPPPLLQALGFFRKPPTDGTFRYLFSLLDLYAFEAALAVWIARLIPVWPQQLRPTPLDGKTLCGSDDKFRGAVGQVCRLERVVQRSGKRRGRWPMRSPARGRSGQTRVYCWSGGGDTRASRTVFTGFGM